MSDVLHSLNYLDFMILGVMCLFFAAGIQRGFARTLAGLVGVALAVVGGTLGQEVLMPKLVGFLRIILVQGLASQLNGSPDFLDQIAGAVVAVLEGTILRTMLFLLCYLGIIALWLYACSYLTLLTKFKGIQKLDKTVGGLIGLVKGFLVLCVAFYVLRRFGIIPVKTLEASYFISKVTAFLSALAG